jgi:hypothetical protein
MDNNINDNNNENNEINDDNNKLSLPNSLIDEIFSYIIPLIYDKKYISYKNNKTLSSDAYNNKYRQVYIHNVLAENRKQSYFGLYLSIIPMKNKKHRYYITKPLLSYETIEDENNRIDDYFYYHYKSIYVGKDIILALILLYNDRIDYDIENNYLLIK